MRATRYRKKPVVIESFRLGIDDMPDWFCDAVANLSVVTHNDDCRHRGGTDWAFIWDVGGIATARCGDWIIRGVNGELYPCKPDIFEATYDKVTE